VLVNSAVRACANCNWSLIRPIDEAATAEGRGLDILQRIQKIAHLHAAIVEEDFPQCEVDMKLIELGQGVRLQGGHNDFNLNKVAQLHGVDVLNINELANALKSHRAARRDMRVFNPQGGQGNNQGVAYLDDGTMVVVDNARRSLEDHRYLGDERGCRPPPGR